MTLLDVPITGDFQIVSNILREHAGDFLSSGFEFSDVKWEGSADLGYFLVFHFANQRTGMVIRLAFFVPEGESNGGFTAMILKPGNHTLNIKEFLKLHGREDLMRFFTYRNPETDVRAFTEAFLRMLNGIFRKELAPTLLGEVWEDTPIDWQGYK
jgi:hypothetical protein